MNVRRLIRSAYLLYFSQPVADRTLFKAIRRRQIRSIVEIGIGNAGRSLRVLEVAGWNSAGGLRYTGVDQFEGRPSGQPRLPLKQAHAALRLPEVKVQLVPGDPNTALRRVANSLAGTDLLLISAEVDREAMAAAWTWLPRMLSDSSLVFVEEPAAQQNATAWRRLSMEDVRKLAAQAGKSARRAA